MPDYPTLFGDYEPEPDPPTLYGRCPCCEGRGYVALTDDVTDLPIPSAPARTEHPDTAHAAAARVAVVDIRRFSAKSRQAQLLAAIADSPMTAQEAAIRVMGLYGPISRLEGCRRRMSDLVASGMIVDSMQRRANIGSPDLAIVYEVTEYGLECLARLNRDGWSIP